MGSDREGFSSKRIPLAIVVALCACVAVTAGGTGRAAQIRCVSPRRCMRGALDPCMACLGREIGRARPCEGACGAVCVRIRLGRQADIPGSRQCLPQAKPAHVARFGGAIGGTSRQRLSACFRRGRLVCAQGFVQRFRGVPQIEVALWDARGSSSASRSQQSSSGWGQTLYQCRTCPGVVVDAGLICRAGRAPASRKGRGCSPCALEPSPRLTLKPSAPFLCTERQRKIRFKVLP